MRNFFNELYRRNVIRATSAYLAFAWLATQIAHLADHAMDISGSAQRWLMMFLCIGLIPTVTFSWRYELMEHGLQEEENIPRPKLVHHNVATGLDRITIIFLLLAFLLAVVDQFAIEPESPHEYRTIELRDSELAGTEPSGPV
ncbi:MAG: hypothetical protein R3200_10525 [Xanthomonadales bacterium]|nr:hypothetical protein [Xanthomonadales bacterium]